jgi:hypothetical protein
MPDFDAIIIGTGQAGPSLAFRPAGAGMKVAVVERHLVGGTCVNTGCTPTKALVASAYAARIARRAAEYGVVIGGDVGINMRRVKARTDAVAAAAISASMDVAACKRPPLLVISSEEVRMDKTVDVTIPVEPEAAAGLADARNREAVGRLVSRVLRPRAGPSPLARAIAELKAEARAVGLSDAEIDAELVAYNAERRDRSSG